MLRNSNENIREIETITERSEADKSLKRNVERAVMRIAFQCKSKCSYCKNALLSDNNGSLWLAIIFLTIALIPIILAYRNSPDNDLWFLISTGREILENGIMHINPFSCYDDQGIVIQQIIPSVIDYVLFSIGGVRAIALFMLVLSVIVLMLYWLLCWKIIGIRCDIAALILIPVFSLLSSYISVRPHVWSMLIFVLIIICLETYRKKGRTPILALLPVLTALHVNIHASMIALDYGIVSCYAIFCNACGVRKGFQARYPIIISLVVMVIASMANPYGLKGAAYLLLSYGAADYENYIMEMNAPSLADWYTVWLLILSGACIFAYGVSVAKHKTDWAMSMAMLGLMFESFMHVRNVWLIALIAAPYLAKTFAICVHKTTATIDDKKANIAYNHFHEEALDKHIYTPDTDNMRISDTKTSTLQKQNSDMLSSILIDSMNKRIISVIGFVCLLVVGTIWIDGSALAESMSPERDNTYTPVDAIDIIDNIANENNVSKDDLSIFCHFNAGGYLEWRGYDVSMDPRPELWQPPITGIDKNIYYDYVDMCKGNISVDEYMKDKEFDYLIVDNDSQIDKWLYGNDNYEKLLDGNGYRLYASAD